MHIVEAITDPTGGCNGESVNSTDEVEATQRFQTSDLMGRSILLDAQPDGPQFRFTVVEAITQHQQDHAQQPEHVKIRIPDNINPYKETATHCTLGPAMER